VSKYAAKNWLHIISRMNYFQDAPTLTSRLLKSITQTQAECYLPQRRQWRAEKFEHKVHVYLEYHSVRPLVWIGTPPPPIQSPASECVPWTNGRGTHSPAGEGVGGVPIRTTGEKASYSVYSVSLRKGDFNAWASFKIILSTIHRIYCVDEMPR
jgi:hypothetical protein